MEVDGAELMREVDTWAKCDERCVGELQGVRPEFEGYDCTGRVLSVHAVGGVVAGFVSFLGGLASDGRRGERKQSADGGDASTAPAPSGSRAQCSDVVMM